MGTVYLLHFERPIGSANPRGQARHYLGYARNLQERLDAHQAGNGSRLMAAVASAGVPWQLARTWRGGRDLERKLKNRHNAKQLCPICKELCHVTPF